MLKPGNVQTPLKCICGNTGMAITKDWRSSGFDPETDILFVGIEGDFSKVGYHFACNACGEVVGMLTQD